MASSIVDPRWLKSTRRVAGRDQLGIQVISIALYSDLLPGLTNVTDRVRYYSFYPWLIHRYASDIKSHDRITWQEHLRRAEFLLALVGCLHHRQVKEGGEAIVGAEQATDALAEIEAKPNRVWRLSRWTAVADAGEKGSYFKNKNGGFGQYYRAQLKSLGLIKFAGDSIGVTLAKGRGTEVAQICDSQKGRADFWKAVKDDKITFAKIAALGDTLCPCAVAHYEKERAFLVKILFGQDELGANVAFSRAQTFRLLLAALKHANQLEEPVPYFRRLAYYERGEKSKRFRPTAALADTYRKWSIYETSEFVNYALEVAFHAILEQLSVVAMTDTDATQFISSTASAALNITSSALGLGTRKSAWCDRTLGDIIDEAQSRQKPLAEWFDDPWSESNLISDLDGEPPLIRLARCFACLVAIHARNRLSPRPFEVFSTVSEDWLGRHQVTLATVFKYLSEGTDGNAALVFAEFLKDYVVGQHLRIAMRKLRYQSQSTFKLAIENGRFIWMASFDPTRTNPRLRQAFRFLRDLGFCFGQSDGWSLTPKGEEQLRQADGN